MSATAPAAPPAAARDWIPEGVAAAVVFVAGMLEVLQRNDFGLYRGYLLLTVTALAAAVLLCRRAPLAALGLVWAIGFAQVGSSTPVLSAEVAAVAAVAFGCARWGSPVTVALSGLSVPAAAGVGALLLLTGNYAIFRDLSYLGTLVDNAARYGEVVLVGAAVLLLLLLAVPWLAGLLVRSLQRTRRSEVSQLAAEQDAARAQREAYQAQEIAHLREEQARLARDVHDVVGHSLAVILAQAESAQYLPDDPERLKGTMATIAESARGSLRDVRQVLSATAEPHPRPGGLEELVAGVRASGQEVVVEEVGTPQPLPPEIEVVAHRVLQEMLTNAVRHGRRDRPITVERHWPGGGHEHDLRIEVANAVPDAPDASVSPVSVTGDTVPIGRPVERPAGEAPAGGPGQGVDGMRRRLDSVGGKLDVRRRDGSFTATAWVPVRAR